MTPVNTAEALLERLLYILPAAARTDGAPIEELARALGVDATLVLRDIEAATARSFYHPAGAVETFSIYIDGSTVHVHAPHEFRRPARLNQREALVLGLGLRMLAADEEEPRRREILALAARLEAELAVPGDTVSEDAVAYSLREPQPEYDQVAEPEVEYDEFALAFDDDSFRGVIVDAIELQRTCTMWYLKAGGDAPMQRRIAPYRLVYAHGMWYVVAYDLDRNDLRFFRMDRVLGAELEDSAAPPAPAQLEGLLGSGAMFQAEGDVAVRVRYSPRIARWIVERSPDAQLESDGAALLEHRVADRRWLVRHVLQYGGEAQVEGPAEAKAWVRDAARAVLQHA